MLDAIFAVAGGYALAVATWLFYLAVMAISPHKDNLHPVAKAHAYVLLVVALALDVTLNVVVGTALFLDPPRELLMTDRLKRYVSSESADSWRRVTAGWICKHLLDQFDPDGDHCGCAGLSKER